MDLEKDSKIAILTYLGMCGFVAVSIVVFGFYGDWVSAISSLGIFLLMLVPALLKGQYRMYLPFELDVAIVTFIFLSLFLGSMQNFYEKIPLWDLALHFMSGLLIGVLGFVVVYIMNAKKRDTFKLSPGFVSLFSICFSLALSVVWEIFEYTMDTFFGFTMQRNGLPDTMEDLIVNAVAAVIVGLFAYLWMKRRERLPFAPKRFKKYILG